MKFSLFLLTAFLFVVQNEVMGKPAPNPSPDNDVHFHVNMPGSGRSFPLKGQGSFSAIDFREIFFQVNRCLEQATNNMLFSNFIITVNQVVSIRYTVYIILISFQKDRRLGIVVNQEIKWITPALHFNRGSKEEENRKGKE